MNRRNFSLGAALGLGAMAVASTRALAQDDDTPLVGAPKIIEALRGKDVVLDRPTPPRPGQPQPRIDLRVNFAFDSAELLTRGQRQLDELARALDNAVLKPWGFLLAGHTDRVGGASYNLRLSLARAESVKAYLTQVHGLAEGRLQTIGFGDSRLLDPARPTAALNRRVEVRRTAWMQAPAAPRSYGGRLVPTP